jgi:hypothetical protein
VSANARMARVVSEKMPEAAIGHVVAAGQLVRRCLKRGTIRPFAHLTYAGKTLIGSFAVSSRPSRITAQVVKLQQAVGVLDRHDG